MSSGYESVVGGKLKLKGKALDVAGGIKKKKRKTQIQEVEQSIKAVDSGHSADGSALAITSEEEVGGSELPGESAPKWDNHLTPAERRYMEQRARIDMHKMAKTANKSHRDRIQDFNQYLANLSEHYDIPKVGPG